MRLISLILAILVLILSCMPCADLEACVLVKPATVILKADPHPQEGSTHSDCCSPFCQCSCCAGCSLPMSASLEITACYLFPVKVYSSFPSQAPREISLPVWQPPQIVTT